MSKVSTWAQRKQRQLIEDVLGARHDVLELAEAHGLKPDELAAWANDTDTQRLLRGLCDLADLQTQFLLSRYRLLAASRLIRLATQEGEGESARKACVDLLKADLKLPEMPDEAEAEDLLTGDALARLVYGDAEPES